MKPSPLIRRHGTVALPMRLFAPVGWYAVMAQYPCAFIDIHERYDKRNKSTHRFDIVSGEGIERLTVPVSRPEGAFLSGRLCWDGVTVSAHGRWWETIPRTLATAYGRSPYFEYYIDRLMPLFAPRPLAGCPEETLAELCLRADAAVRAILGLPTEIVTEPPGEVCDMRGADFAAAAQPPYYQVHAGIHGFVPGLSILDLIFNMGPEAPLLLAQY